MERKRLEDPPAGMPEGWTYFRSQPYKIAGRTMPGTLYATCPRDVAGVKGCSQTVTAESYDRLCEAVQEQHAAMIAAGIVSDPAYA